VPSKSALSVMISPSPALRSARTVPYSNQIPLYEKQKALFNSKKGPAIIKWLLGLVLGCSEMSVY
jgi:hypothetical protein